MLATIKQNDLKLITTDLWASTLAISDLVSDPDKIDPGYQQFIVNKYMNAYDFSIMHQESKDFEDWEKVLWLLAPESESDPNFQAHIEDE